MSNLIKLKDLIDMLIDIEQSGEGELVMGELPVVSVTDYGQALRVDKAFTGIHNKRISLFGLVKGDQYITLRTL